MSIDLDGEITYVICRYSLVPQRRQGFRSPRCVAQQYGGRVGVGETSGLWCWSQAEKVGKGRGHAAGGRLDYLGGVGGGGSLTWRIKGRKLYRMLLVFVF